MANDGNILQNIARGYRKALAPASEAANTPETRDELLRTTGQQPDTTAAKPADTTQSQKNADSLLDKSPKDFTKEDWKNVLIDLKNIYKALKDFIKQTDFSSGWDTADEATFFLVQVLTTDFIFKTYPLIYTIADATGLAQDQVLGIRGLKDTLADWNSSSADRFFPDLRQRIIQDTGLTEQRLEAVTNLRENIRTWKKLIDENNPNIFKVVSFHLGMEEAEAAAIPDLTTKIQAWYIFLENGTQYELHRSMRMFGMLGYIIMGVLNAFGIEAGKTLGVAFGSEAETGNAELDSIVRRLLTLYVHLNNPTTEGGAASGETFIMSITNAPENEQLRDGYVVSFRGAGGLKMPLEAGYAIEINASAPDIVLGFSAKKHAALKGLKTVESAAAYVMARLTNEQAGGIYRLGDANGSNISFDTWSAEVRGSVQDISVRATARFSLNLVKEADSDNFLKKHLLKDGVRKELEIGLGMSLIGGIFVTLGNSGPFYLAKPKEEKKEETERALARSRDVTAPNTAAVFEKELQYKLNKTVGPLQLDDLFLLLQAKFADTETAGSASAGLNFGVKIGPVSAAVEGMGIRLTLNVPTGATQEPAPELNLGIANLDFGFKPPVGIALSIAAKVIEGTGYLRFDPERGTYIGSLSLSIKKKLTVSAVGILHTKLPEIPGGYSLVLLVNATFEPGISLAFGFFLKGLGGILGLHRTIAVERVRGDMTSGGIEKILFPNIDAMNVRQLVQDLDHYFPVKSDQFFGGLMARIVWGTPTILILDIGLILEGPSPWRLVLVGMIKATLPNPEKQLLVLRCAILGEIDFEKGYLALDARLYDSRLLTFALLGDVALRMRWSSESGFLLSVGGFHPAFKPPANLNPGNLTRITFRLADIDNPELVMTAYFAVTSNTVQFGARADAKAKIGNVRIEGYLHFDALFQFSPFRMMVGLGGGVAVSYRGYDLFSVKVEGTLVGPGPWTIHLTLSFSVWWWDVEVDYSKTWGQVIEDSQLAVAVLPLVKETLKEPASWTAVVANNRFLGVRMKEQPAGENAIFVQPIGSLRISQTVAPLSRNLDKFGNNRISDVQNIAISQVKVSGQGIRGQHSKVEEDFAPALFRNMSEDERLKAKSFEKETGGLIFQDDDLLTNFSFSTDSAYEQLISDFNPVSTKEKDLNPNKRDWQQRVLIRANRLKEPLNLDPQEAEFFVKTGAIARSPLSKENRLKRQVLPGKTALIWQERFTIAHTEQLERWEQFTKGSQAEAETALRQAIRANPNLKGKLEVVPEYVF